MNAPRIECTIGYNCAPIERITEGLFQGEDLIIMKLSKKLSFGFKKEIIYAYVNYYW